MLLLIAAGCGPSGTAPPLAPASTRPASAPAAAVPASSTAPATSQSLDAGLKPAFALANAGDFDGARAAVARYLQDAGVLARNYQAEFLIGYTFQKQKTYASAREHLQRAVELAPDYQPPWHYLGFACYYLGDLERARAAFTTHQRFAPGEGDDCFGLGLVAFDEDRLDDAEREFRRAIELHTAMMQRDPAGRARVREVTKSRARLADVLMRREQWAEARVELEQAVALWPAQPDVWHKLHDVLLRLGEQPAAAEALRHRDEARALLGRGGAASEDER